MIFRPILPLIPFSAAAAAVILITAVLILKGEGDAKKRICSLAFLLAAALLTFCIELRPMRAEKKTDVEVKNTDVLFVVDGSISMWAEDGTYGTRMDDVRAACGRIISDLQGASFGVVSFDRKSRIMAPFTQDTTAVTDALAMITEPSTDYAKGSSLNAPLADILKMAEFSKKKEDRLTVILFFSDGEITDGSELVSYEPVRAYTDIGAVFCAGSPEGGKMKDQYGIYIRDDNYDYGISVPDEETLGKIAQDIGGTLEHLEGDGDAASRMGAQIREASFVTMGQEELEVYNDTYYIFAALLLILLAAGAFFTFRKMPL